MSLRKPDPIREAIKGDTRAIERQDGIPDGALSAGRRQMKVYRVRLPEADVERFLAYLGRQGLSLSAGIRMAVAKFMQKEGLK